MSRWVLVALLALEAHFAASYLVPLDAQAQRTFGGLLRWAWPWSDGDRGPLGEVTAARGFPLAGFFLAAAAAVLLLLAALAVAGVWVPTAWWRALAAAGAAVLVVLMALFLAPTKVIPIAAGLLTLYFAIRAPATFSIE